MNLKIVATLMGRQERQSKIEELINVIREQFPADPESCAKLLSPEDPKIAVGVLSELLLAETILSAMNPSTAANILKGLGDDQLDGFLFPMSEEAREKILKHMSASTAYGLRGRFRIVKEDDDIGFYND